MTKEQIIRRKQQRLFVVALIIAGSLLVAGEALATPHDNDAERSERNEHDDGPADDGPNNDGPDDGPNNDGPTSEAPSRSSSGNGGKSCDDYVSLQKLPRQCAGKVVTRSVDQEEGSKR